MTILQKLKAKFTDLPSRNDPMVARRNQLAARLAEQKQLFENPDFVRVSKHWTGKGAERQQVERRQPVRPWWKETSSGGAVMSIKRGFTVVTFEGNKAGIAVSSRDELPSLIDELRQAVLAGELDHALQAKSKRPGNPTKAASNAAAAASAKVTAAVDAAMPKSKSKQPVTA
jgi:hypothetical protein